jgi:hypothetical protein
MKINQALKKKNQLASELSELSMLIRTNNSTVEGNPKHYFIKNLIEDYDIKLVELVELKTKIHKANLPIYDKIFLLSELKGKVNMYKGIPIVEGKVVERYSQSQSQVMVVEYNVKEMNYLIKDLEAQINNLQEQLDYHNATTNI